MITQWTYGDKPVRVQTDDDGTHWFVAKDVCDALDISQPTRAVEPLSDDEKGVNTIHTPGGPQKVLTVNEPGLYRLIFQSRKPEAEAFQRWVTHDVLPSIRKTGQYGNGADQLDTLASAAKKFRTAIAVVDHAAGAFLGSYDEAKKHGENFKNAVKRERHVFEALPSAPPQSWFYIWLVVKIGAMLQIKTGITTNLVATEQDYKRQNPKGRWLLKKLIAVDTIAIDLEAEIQDRILPQQMRLHGECRSTESFDIPDYLLNPFIVHCEELAELTITNVQVYKRPQTLWG